MFTQSSIKETLPLHPNKRWRGWIIMGMIVVVLLGGLSAPSFAYTKEELYKKLFGKTMQNETYEYSAKIVVDNQFQEAVILQLNTIKSDFQIPFEAFKRSVMEQLRPEFLSELDDNQQDGMISSEALKRLDYTVRLNKIYQQLLITTPINKRTYLRVFVRPNDPNVIGLNQLQPSTLSAYSNIRLNSRWYDNNASNENHSLDFDTYLQYKRWVLRHRTDLVLSPNDDTINNTRRVTLMHDFGSPKTRLTMGEMDAEGAGLYSVPEMVGVAVKSIGELRFQRLSRGLTSESLFLIYPAKVGVFVNGTKQGDFELPAGEIKIENIPLQSGLNFVETEVDYNGLRPKEHRTRTVIADTNLLAQDQYEFNVRLGAPLNEDSTDRLYDGKHTLVSVSGMYGVQDHVNMGVFFQRDIGRRQAGYNAAWSSPLGRWLFDTSVSRAERNQKGVGSTVTFRPYIPRDTTDAYLKLNGWDMGVGAFSDTYVGFGANRAPAQTVKQFNTSVQIGMGKKSIAIGRWVLRQNRDGDTGIGMSLGYSRRLNEAWELRYVAEASKDYNSSGRYSNILNMIHEKQGPWTLQLYASSDYEKGKTTQSFGFGFKYRFDEENGREIAGGYETRGKPHYYADYFWDNKNLNLNNQIHYENKEDEQRFKVLSQYQDPFSDAQLSYEQNQTDINQIQDTLQAQIQHMRGRLNISKTQTHSQSGSDSGSTFMSMETALLYADGSWGISKPVQKGFIMVEQNESIKSADLIMNSNSRSDILGGPVNQNFTLYQPQRVFIEGRRLPLGYHLEKNAFTFVPEPYMGYKISLGNDERTAIVTGRFITKDETQLSYKIGYLYNDEKTVNIRFFTNKQGEFQVLNVPPGTYWLRLSIHQMKAKKIQISPKTKGHEKVSDIVVEYTD